MTQLNPTDRIEIRKDIRDGILDGEEPTRSQLLDAIAASRDIDRDAVAAVFDDLERAGHIYTVGEVVKLP